MINKLIETKKELASNWKMIMDYYQKIIDEVNPYELTEFLNANCSMNFAKGMYMALTREIQDLEEMKTHQLHNLNEVKSYLMSQKVTPEMVAIAMRKIEISILGVDIDE